MKDNYILTAESVTAGHPDKLCDTIADNVLDACLKEDPNARVACEVLATAGKILVAGELRTTASPDVEAIVRQTVRNAGYDCNYNVEERLHTQSPDIAGAVDGETLGAGDQGIMFGYATDETPEMMPTSIALAHRLSRRLAAVRKDGTLPWLRPDGKSQVTVEFEDGRPVRVDSVLIAAQHDPDVSEKQIREEIIENVIKPSIDPQLLDANTRYLVNATGRFVIGGPMGDAGLTGRKIIVDTYGGVAHHGGGAFSGKDPTKVDRSAAYAARYVAKNIVAAGLAKKCELALSYAIGVARPLSLRVDTFGTGAVSEEKLEKIVGEAFDLRPNAIIRALDLRRPIYRQTAAYGHFGRTDLDLPWERTDKAEILRAMA